MKRTFPDLTGDETVFEIPLDDVSVARLMAVADAAKIDPRVFLAAIVRDVLEDDEIAHGDGLDGPDPLAHKHLN